jgi:hypothetical protein
MKGFKGFNEDMTCRGLQYEVSKEYETEKAELCRKGFHFCGYPLDVFDYYPPASSRFAEVEGNGQIVEGNDDNDTKVSCTKIKIGAEISFQAMIEAAIKFTFDKAKWIKGKQATGDSGAASATGDSGAASATGDSGAASATGDRGAASATGDRGAASATGDRGAASATGYSGAASATGYSGAASATGDRGAASATGYSGAASATGNRGAASATGNRGAASATGKNSVASALGIESKAKGTIGTWLVIAEWAEDKEYNWYIKSIKTVQVDGKKIKEDTYYTLKRGKFVKEEE